MFRSLVLTSCLLAASQMANAASTYTVVQVSPPASYVLVSAMRVNDKGHFLAQANDLVGNLDWFFWTPELGYVKIIGPSGGHVDFASGLNNSDQVVGTAENVGFVWDPLNGATAIPVPAGYTEVIPTAINGKGTVVGSLSAQAGSNSFTWSIGHDVEPLATLHDSTAQAVNELGQVAANWHKPRKTEAVFAKGFKQIAMIGFVASDPGSSSLAVDVNDSGEMAIDCSSSGGMISACSWTKRTGLRYLGPVDSEVYAIDNAGEIVGYTYGFDGPSGGFVYERSSGVILLQNALATGSPSYDFISPADIAPGTGIIAGGVQLSGVSYAVLLMPQ